MISHHLLITEIKTQCVSDEPVRSTHTIVHFLELVRDWLGTINAKTFVRISEPNMLLSPLQRKVFTEDQIKLVLQPSSSISLESHYVRAN